MKVELNLELLNRDGKVLHRHRQPSRSFVRNFLSLLYVAHAQLTDSAPYYPFYVDACGQDIDSQTGTGSGQRAGKANLMLAAPPGSSQVICSPGSFHPDFLFLSCLAGEDIGIQVGKGASAVTPGDWRMGERIAHGTRPPDVSPLVFESLTTGDTHDREMYGNYWCAQPFIPYVSHRISSVRLKSYKEGSPGDLTVAIQGARYGRLGGSPYRYYQPAYSGNILVSGAIPEASMPSASPGDFVECTFPSPVDVYAGHVYFIVAYIAGGSSSNSVHWRYGGYYAKWPGYWYSTDGAASWNAVAGNECFLFEEKGQSIGELEYGGCELLAPVFSNPDGPLTIRRFFTNNCGQAITVSEVGMQSVGTDYGDRCAWPFLVARDVVSPGIEVASGQLLKVEYIPRITV